MVGVGLVVDVLKDGLQCGSIHANVPLVDIPECSEDAANSFSAFLEGEGASCEPNIDVAVVIVRSVGRHANGGTEPWEVLLDDIPIR